MNFRNPTVDDIPQIAKIIQEVTEDNYGVKLSDEESLDDAKYKFEECEKELSFVVEEEGKIVGKIFIRLIVPWKWKIPEVSVFGVLRDFRKQGIGTKLMELMITSLKRAKYKEVKLACLIENEKALNLYEKLGFEKKKYELIKKL